MLERILDKVDKKVFYYSLICAVVRYGCVLIGDVNLRAIVQLAVGILTIILIFIEFRRDKRYGWKHYITYFLGAFFMLIILNAVRLLGESFLTKHFLLMPLVWTWTAIIIAVWALVNAFLFEFFKKSSHKMFDKTHF